MELIDIFDLLPRKTYVKLKDDFRQKLIEKCVIFCGGVNKFAKILNVERQKIYKFKGGKLRISIENLRLMLKLADISLNNAWYFIDGFAGQGAKNTIKPPRYFKIDKKFGWFFGIRLGDRAENKNQIGICNSDISILKKFYGILLSYKIARKSIKLYVYTKNKQVRDCLEKTFTFAEGSEIKYYNKKSSNFYCLIQSNNALLHKIVYGLEKLKIQELHQDVKRSFLQGFADAEAHVDLRGEIIFSQKSNRCGKRNIKNVQCLLKEMEIETKIYENSGNLRLLTYKKDLKKYQELIGFSSDRKNKELHRVIEIYSKKRDLRDIQEDIIRISKNPITRKEIAFLLKSKRCKVNLYIRKMEKERKIKIINKRPLTIISLKEALHDSL